MPDHLRYGVAGLCVAATLAVTAAVASPVAQAGNMTVQVAPWQAWMGEPEHAAAYEAARATARVRAEQVGPSRVRIDLAVEPVPGGFGVPLVLQVEFVPRWPGYEYDLEVLDDAGARMPARRPSYLARQLLIPVPARSATCFVQATRPDRDDPPPPDEAARGALEPQTGLVANVCRWFDGRQAAVSFRFDDSYPSHILTAIPVLREYGYTGTFFINPGSGEYLAHREAWETCAAQGDQEFANHTMHHHGARDDDEVDRELGEPARYIRGLFPGKSALICFNPGGGTVWTHSRPLRQFLDKHRLVDARPRLAISMTNARVEEYRALLDRGIETGAWVMSLFHQIDTPWVSEETFRAVLEITRGREAKVWIAGMAAVHKYERARDLAALTLHAESADAVRMEVSCGTDPALYDQPLTVQLSLPEAWEPHTVEVRDAAGAAIVARVAEQPGKPVVRFDVPARNATYRISR